MKYVLICFLAVSTIVFSCKSKPGGTEETIISKKTFPHIDNKRIAYIKLQIADTSLIDPLHKPLIGLARIGRGASFIDSTGRQTLNPTQTILFKGASKDSLLAVFNGYLDSPQDSLTETACMILYRHVFTIYDTVGKIDDRAYLCLDCTRFDFVKRNAYLKFLDKDAQLFSLLIKQLRKSGAYLPINGPASSVQD
jgi:hypothetical protein